MINKHDLAVRMAYQSMQLLQLAAEIQLTMDIYQGSGMANEVFVGAGTTPEAIYTNNLSFNDLEGDRLALEGLKTYLDANSNQFRIALAKVVGARNG